MVKNPPANAGDARDEDSISRSGRSPGGGNGNSFRYSCLENSMDRGVWQATVHGVAKIRTQLNDFTFFLFRFSAYGNLVCPWKRRFHIDTITFMKFYKKASSSNV